MFRTAVIAALAGSALSASAHPTLERLRLNGDGGAVAENAVFSMNNTSLLSQLPLSAFPSNPGDGNDCWGYVSPSGREYALMGLSNALAVVEITDPTNPQIIGSITSASSPWRDIKTMGEYAYVVSEAGDLGLQVVDLSQVDQGIVSEVRRVTTGGTRSTHNVVVNEDTGFIYRVGGGNNIGLRAYATGKPDALGNPTPGTPDNPVFVGQLNNFYVHDAQVVTYSRPGPYQGREIAFACSGTGNGSGSTALRIYDVTNKSSVQLLRTISYTSSAYSHQGWLSEDQRYFYLNDELDEGSLVGSTTMRIFDLDPNGNGNLTQSQFLRADSNGINAIDHNLYVKGSLLFATNYTSGLRISDLSDPTDPVEIASFDTYPNGDGVSFNGAWSNYPYLPSGNIIVSDINSGLFIIHPQIPSVAIAPTPLPSFLDPQGGTVLQANFAGAFGSQLDTGTVSLKVRGQSGAVTTVPGVDVGGGNYQFATPALDCGTTASVWFEASTTQGQVETLPAGAPIDTFEIAVADDEIVGFFNSGQDDPDFSVTGDASDGTWTPGVPVNNGRGDPAADFDGDGTAWLTDNVAGNTDVDGGTTRLTTPAIDATDGGTLSWAYWLNDISGGELGAEDSFTVDVATNAAGTNWVEVARYTQASAQWREDSLVVGSGQLIGATPTLRVRFSASDLTPGDVVEAGVDAIRFASFQCDPSGCGNPADVNGDNVLTGADFNAWLSAFSAGDLAADQNGDAALTGADFNAFIANFSQGCND